MVARRLRLASLAWVCVLAGGLALGGVSAQAAVIHEYLPQASQTLSEGVPAGSGAPVTGPLSSPIGMAVDSGHLWDAELIEGVSGSPTRIDEFDAATGSFVSQFPRVPSLSFLFQGVAVAHGTGDVYVGGDEEIAGKTEGVVAVFNPAGSLLGVWTGADTPGEAKAFGCFDCAGPGDVAVDNSVSGPAAGDVYVSSPLLHVVDVLKKPAADGKEPSEENVGQLTGTCPVEGTACGPAEVIPFGNLSQVAVDASSGHLLVLDSIIEEGSAKARSVIDVFEPELLGGYVFVRQIKLAAGDQAGTVAVDGGTGEIYVAGMENGLGAGFVEQFSAAGVFLGRITGENTPSGLSSPQSVAIDPESHHVFVGHRSVVDVFGPDIVIPDVISGPAASVTRNGAILTGTVKLDKEGEATCQFVWGTTKEFGQPPAPCPKAVTEEESAVQATLSELEPDTTYYYRLQATNKNGLNVGESSQDRQFTTPGPGIHSESVSGVASTSATLSASIDPHGAPTSYYFQYGTTTSYGASAPVPPGLPLGSGEGDVEAPQYVEGLEADTVYHYRVVAIGEPTAGRPEEFDGPDKMFTTQPGGGALSLPDGRGWELVSPADKYGALIFGIGATPETLTQASVAGDALTYVTRSPTEAEPPGTVIQVQVFSKRGVGGWSSRDIATRHDAESESKSEYPLFSEDLSVGLVEPRSSFTPQSALATEQTPYLRRQSLCEAQATVGECYLPLVTGKEGYADVPPGTKFDPEPEKGFGGVFFEGATPDLKHVIIRSHTEGVSLTSTPARKDSLYEWSADKPPAERLQLVSVLPQDQGGAATEAMFGGFNIEGTIARGAITRDGSRVFWSREGFKNLYVRDLAKGETLQIDVRQPGVAPPQNPGAFYNAAFQFSADNGSKVFFTDGENLTTDARGEWELPDLYECDIVEEAGKLACRLRDLTPGAGLRDLVLGGTEDGSYVYFVANGVLGEGAKEGAKPGNCSEEYSSASAKRCNLYLLHEGKTKFVATLSGLDESDWSGVQNVRSQLSKMTVRMSPDGRFLTFMSNRSLTGYDNRDVNSGQPDEEVYLYDAQTARLVCASCNPSGARPVGVEQTGHRLVEIGTYTKWFGAFIPSWTMERYQSRYLSASGRLFFDSPDALVPQDINGTMDVYEYEPAGVGSCTRSSMTFSVSSNGCVGLVSSGSSADESVFMDASETGDDVFFLTSEKLLAQDTDTGLDVYDAHVCSSASPCPSSPVAAPSCTTADACRAAPLAQPPGLGAPSSATFAGAGNVNQPATGTAAKARGLTRTQKLARALSACHRKKGRGKRAVCERQARRQYGAKRSRKANATNRSRG
jgi:hypothetical protein